MGWDGGRYYSRSKRVGGKVVREYVGRGPLAALAAALDAADRDERQQRREAEGRQAAELDALDAAVRRLDEVADAVAEAALIAAGFRKHKRSEWRRRRER